MAKRAPRRYKVRLEDPNSDEFRILYLNATSPEEARAICEEKEAKIVAFSVADADLEDLEQREKERGRPPFQLVAHRQSAPYVVASVELRGEA